MLAKVITARQRLWLSHFKSADESKGSIADYAEAHELRLKTLYQWKSKLVKLELYKPTTKTSKSPFVPVAPIQSVSSKPSCKVKLTNGTVIEFAGELDAKMVRSIITSSVMKR